jgi:hypothetical protein
LTGFAVGLPASWTCRRSIRKVMLTHQNRIARHRKRDLVA